MTEKPEGPLDPTKRYLRCELCHVKSRTTVYRCLDQEESIQADWNEIDIHGIKPERIEKLTIFLKSFATFHSPNILSIYRAWIDQPRQTLIYISELFTRKTLRDYVTEVARNPGRAAIGKWCIQIINGLEQLHNCNPPLTHNNLSCDNIYIDANEGLIKIEIPSFEYILFDSIPPTSAPEVHRGYGEPKSDIWDLGLCVAEMATGEIPYSEIATMAKQKQEAASGKLPSAIGQISDPTVADFVTNCLLPVDLRPDINQVKELALISESADSGDFQSDDRKVDLLEQLQRRQKSEIDEMEARHLRERNALREKIRAKRAKPRSLRELLNESI